MRLLCHSFCKFMYEIVEKAQGHCNTFKCPFFAAYAQVSASHSHSFSRNHCNTSKCPLNAACEQVNASQSHPFARAHCNTFKCPFPAADVQRRLPVQGRIRGGRRLRRKALFERRNLHRRRR